MRPDQLVVVILPDTGERYLSKAHSDEWLRDNHLLDPEQTRVRDLLEGKSVTPGTPAIVWVGEDEPVRRAVALVRGHDVSQIPVLRGNEVVGTVFDAEVLKTVLEDPQVLDRPVKQVMDRALPEVAPDEPLARITRLLADRNPAVLVRENGGIVGILTRFDLVGFIAE
jgi:cystathionine beta-synthase